MGLEEVEKRADDQLASYSIISFPGTHLPSNYHPVVQSKWKRSYKYDNEYFKLIDDDAYYQAYSRYINHILSRPDTLVKLAVLSDDLDVVIGFSVHQSTNVLHYLHVHKDHRHLGIGRSLLPKNFDTFTHITKKGMRLWPKYPQAKFNPFL